MNQDVLDAEEEAALAAWWTQAFAATSASATHESP
jgi:hypothetical protein